MDMFNRYAAFSGTFLHRPQHLMGTDLRENYYKVGISQLIFKARRHLSEHLGFVVGFPAYILIVCSHAVISAYDSYTNLYLYLLVNTNKICNV